MIIVKSKITGKFLKQHSGSARNLGLSTYCKVVTDESLDLPEDDGSYYSGTSKELNDRAQAIHDEMHRRMFDSDAMGARRYASKGSVLTSIGVWSGDDTPPEGRTKKQRKKFKYMLPDYLELHEVKEKKKKDCK